MTQRGKNCVKSRIPRTHSLQTCPECIEKILDEGVKYVIRYSRENVRKIRPGDTVELHNHRKTCRVRIECVISAKTLAGLAERISQRLKKSLSLEVIRTWLAEIFSRTNERLFGVRAFLITPLQNKA